MAIFTLLQPAPTWLSVTPSGLMAVDSANVPTTGFTGAVTVRAVDGTAIANKIITIAIQAKYQLVQDFLEISEYEIGGVSGTETSEITIATPIGYFTNSNDGISFTDLFLGGFGALPNQVTVQGVGVTVGGVPVLVSPQDVSLPATFASGLTNPTSSELQARSQLLTGIPLFLGCIVDGNEVTQSAFQANPSIAFGAESVYLRRTLATMSAGSFNSASGTWRLPSTDKFAFLNNRNKAVLIKQVFVVKDGLVGNNSYDGTIKLLHTFATPIAVAPNQSVNFNCEWSWI